MPSWVHLASSALLVRPLSLSLLRLVCRRSSGISGRLLLLRLWLLLRSAARVLHGIGLLRWACIAPLTQVVHLLRAEWTARIGPFDRSLLLLERRGLGLRLGPVDQRTRLIPGPRLWLGLLLELLLALLLLLL